MNQFKPAVQASSRRNKCRPAALTCLLVAFAFSFSTGTVLAGSHKLRVKDPALAEQLVARGGKVLADYGSFKLIETDEATSVDARKDKAQSDDDSDFIELNSKRLNTRTVEVKSLRKARGTFIGSRLHIIQFAGPIKPEWKDALEKQGARIISYVPNNAFLIYGDAKTLTRLQSWSSVTNIVQWEGDYSDSYKIHPNARTRNAFGQPQQLDGDTFAIQLIEDSQSNSNTLALINSLKLEPIKREFHVLQYLNLIVCLPAEQMATIAAQPDVLSIQVYLDPEKRDERQAQIMAGNLTGSAPSGPGYLAWLTSKGFSQEQFTSSGFAVDVSDSGIDNGTTAPGHFGLYANGNLALSSRVIYNRIEGTLHSWATAAGCDGHGNLNAHILGGFNDATAVFPHADSGGYRYGLGVCPFVKIGSSVIFDPDFFTSPNYADLQSKAYQSGARISANSWGATNNTYTVDSQAFDALVRDAQPAGSTFATSGNQEMVIVFAAGNRGNGANTVGSPGTAKNVITVGASENVRSLNTSNGGRSSFGSDGCGYADDSADAANDLATFSSRGPCSDGRQKPDLVAPGTHITGGVAQSVLTNSGNGSALPCFKASSICALSGGGATGSTNNFFPLGQQFYTVSSGTSHSTPAVAGACALLRQYFINSNMPPPSPAMTKAYLMNSTRYLTGAGANDAFWSPGQGMGALNLGRAFDGARRILRDQVEVDTFTASGQTHVFTGRIADSSKPVRVTLAWTDAPGNTTGNAFNNDLDLIVSVNGSQYKGNNFSGPVSVPGGSSDTRNNVESVLFASGNSGDITITVSAANINSDGVPNYGTSLDQDFALVVYNVTNTSMPVISTASLSLAAEGCFPTNGVIDPGETVTVNLGLKNTGTLAASGLTATLLSTNGVSSPSGAQSYGNLLTDGTPTARSFTFAASGSCGGTINPTFQLHDASGNLGLLTLNLSLGLTTIQTSTFTNTTPITIPDAGKASVYPSAIAVSGLSGALVKVAASLRGYSHSWPDDVDVLLVGPAGQKVMLMSDCGGGNARNGITLTFDDSAPASVPDSAAFASGNYKPTNIDSSSDNLPSPAPASPFGSAMSAFNGSNPNGNWSLYIQDDGSMDGGSVTQGWTLSITTSNLSCCNSSANSADIGVHSAFSAAQAIVGSNVNLTITVTNRGPDTAAFVVVTNILPTGLGFSFASVSQGSYVSNAGVIKWSAGTINPNTSATMNVSCVALAVGSQTNQSSLVAATPDAVLADNAALCALLVEDASSSSNTLVTNLLHLSNSPPVLAAIADRIVHAGALVSVANSATDADSPTNALSFALLPGAPTGSSINSNSGLFTWLTSDANADTTNTVTVQVSDNSIPTLTDSKSFLVTVISRPLITGIVVTNGQVNVTWTSLPSTCYQLQCATNLAGGNWSAVIPDVTGVGTTLTHTNSISSRQQFYRVLVVP